MSVSMYTSGNQCAHISSPMRHSHSTTLRCGLFALDFLHKGVQLFLHCVQMCGHTFHCQGRFDNQGRIDPPESLGEVVVFFGTHLGAVREEAFISHDYDMDVVLFLKKGARWEEVWKVASSILQRLGYVALQHSAQKARICPADPICWDEWAELKQQIKENKPGLSRGPLCKKTSKLFRTGHRSIHPHGSNCVDIDVCTVRQGKPVRDQLL